MSASFPFFPDDFLGSGTVGTASVQEVGIYTLLLCLDWQENGFLFDEKRCARWCRVGRKSFRSAWSHLKGSFIEINGRLFSPKLIEVREKQAAFRERQAQAARMRWDSHGNATAMPTHMPDACQNDAPHPHPNTTTTTTTSVRKKRRTHVDKYVDDFNGLWGRYPRRAGSNPRRKALAAYTARRDEGVTVADLADGLARYITFCEATQKIGTEFVMQGARFFGPSEPWREAWEVPAPSPRGWQKPAPAPTNRSTEAPAPKSTLCPFCRALPGVSPRGRTEVLHEPTCHLFDDSVLPLNQGDHAA